MSNAKPVVTSPANALWYITPVACITLATLTTGQNLLITWSKRSGGYRYNFVTVTLMAEVLKFCISVFMLVYRELPAQRAATQDVASTDESNTRRTLINLRHELSWAGFKERLPFAVPALLYFAKNNLMFLGLRLLDPVSFQLLGNLKVLTTTILYWLMMSRKLSDLKWISLLLLTIGLAVAQLKSDAQLSVTTAGIGIMVLIACLSGLAAIFTEYLMKSNPKRKHESVHLQNAWLYTYGILFNAIAVVMDDWEAVRADGLFHDYTAITVVLLLNNSFSGLAVAAIMKYSNNLVKLFTFATSLMLTTIFSILFFEYELTPRFVLGGSVVFISIYLYNRKEGGGL